MHLAYLFFFLFMHLDYLFFFLFMHLGYAHALVLIGDDLPHEKNQNPEKIDWREQCKLLVCMHSTHTSILYIRQQANQKFKGNPKNATICSASI